MDLKLKYGEKLVGYWIPTSQTEVECLFGKHSYEKNWGKVPGVIFEDESGIPIQQSTFANPVLCIENKSGTKILRRVSAKSFSAVQDYVGGNILLMNPYVAPELERVVEYVRVTEEGEKRRRVSNRSLYEADESAAIQPMSQEERLYRAKIAQLNEEFAARSREVREMIEKTKGISIMTGTGGGLPPSEQVQFRNLWENTSFKHVEIASDPTKLYPVSPEEAFLIRTPSESAFDADMNELLYYRKRAGG